MAFTTPALSQTATLENWYRSQQVTESLLLSPEVYPDLVKRYGKQDFNMNGLTQKLGGISFIQNLDYRHSEENFLHEVLQFDANDAGEENDAVTLTLSTDYDFTFPHPAITGEPYYTSHQTTAVPVYVNQIVWFPDGTRSIVTAVTGNSVTVIPTTIGAHIPAVLTTDVMWIGGNQVGEYATINPSRDTQLIWYFNNMSNMNGSYNISGNARAEKLWISTDKGNVWFYVAQMNESMRLKNERETRILTDTKTTNTTFTGGSGSAAAPSTNISSEGMIPFIESYGNQLPYNLISFITEQDFENLVTTQLIPNVAAPEYALYSSANVINYNNRWIRSEMKNGAWEYGAALGSKNEYVNFMFDSFTVSGHTFHQKHYDLFNYAKLLGATGQPYPYMALGIPLDSSDKSVNWDDMTSTKYLPSFVIHYQKSTDGYNRQWEEYMTGGANGVYTEAVDHQQVNYQTTFGFEGFAPNRYFRIFKA
jgi:hypothetical protein